MAPFPESVANEAETVLGWAMKRGIIMAMQLPVSYKTRVICYTEANALG